MEASPNNPWVDLADGGQSAQVTWVWMHQESTGYSTSSSMRVQAHVLMEMAAGGADTPPRSCGRGGLLSPEAAEDPAEQAALAGQRRCGRRRDRALGGDRLVVVGPRDGIDGLWLVEVLGALDLGHEPDQVPVLHDLRLKPDRAVGVPFGLAPVVQVHPHPEL